VRLFSRVDLQKYQNLADPNDGTQRIQADLNEIEKIKAEFSDASISGLIADKLSHRIQSDSSKTDE